MHVWRKNDKYELCNDADGDNDLDHDDDDVGDDGDNHDDNDHDDEVCFQIRFEKNQNFGNCRCFLF